ncbi:MAG: hypothetical protein IKB73_06070 [Ruminococcus sp.]|nr:hypothetical protein [Ruminococcus sp.]
MDRRNSGYDRRTTRSRELGSEHPRRRSRRELERQRERKKKLMAKRVTIVTIMILILILIVTAVVAGVRALISSGDKKSKENTTPTVAATESKEEITFKAPEIEDDKKSKGYFSTLNSGVFIYNKSALELFSGTDESAIEYAECISDFKTSVKDEITVYNMVVPSHIEFALPERVKKENSVNTNSQADFIKSVYTNYIDDVIPINCYNELSEHSKEYLYFNTDNYWTGLGAYYGYKAFCEQTDQRVLDLSVCKENTIEGFEGELAYCDSGLYENLDTVYFWTFPYSTYAMRTDSMGSSPYETSVYFEGESSGPYAYGVFIWGDCPTFVEYNKDLTNGKKIAVVKDSFGNAMVPYLTANYEEVHVIDYSYYEDNLKTYCQDNGITEVLFVNSTLTANSQTQIENLYSLY